MPIFINETHVLVVIWLNQTLWVESTMWLPPTHCEIQWELYTGLIVVKFLTSNTSNWRKSNFLLGNLNGDDLY